MLRRPALALALAVAAAGGATLADAIVPGSATPAVRAQAARARTGPSRLLAARVVRPVRAPPPRVTLIGDSVADELSYIQPARVLLGHGLKLDLQLAACRRLVEPSCAVAGVQPPTALDVIHTLGRALGSEVVMAVGYNDYELIFARDVHEVLAALRLAGVTHVYWLTLREVHRPYVEMNAALRAIAAHDHELTIVDWNRDSRGHPSWFDADGLHLTPAGATALAGLLHRTLDAGSLVEPVSSR